MNRPCISSFNVSTLQKITFLFWEILLLKEADTFIKSTFFCAVKFLGIRKTCSFWTKVLSHYLLFQTRLAGIFNAAIKELDVKEKEGSDDDTEHVNNLNRVNVIQFACRFGNARCRRLTTARLTDIESISVDLLNPVLCGGLRGANQSVWNAVYDRSLTETNELLKSRLTSALSCSEDESILNK